MKKMNNPTWLDETQSTEAYDRLQQLPIQDTAALNQWCEYYLNRHQWQKMKNAIRVARKRCNATTKTVNLTSSAWVKLSQRAAKEGCTLSEVIERYL